MSYLGVEYYSFHNNIIGFIVGFIITLLVSYVWKVCNETMLPFVDTIFLYSSFTRHHNSHYLKVIILIFFAVLDLINCCKFQNPMTKSILKESVAKLKLWNVYKNYLLKHKIMVYINKNNISKVMLFNILQLLMS